MFTHYNDMVQAAQGRREQYLAEAERARLQQMAHPPRVTASRRLRRAVGNQLVAAGERLRREQQPNFDALPMSVRL